jgi:hypothetical protein
MAIADTSIVAAVKQQVSCDLAGETVILSLADGIYYGLNAVGARVWSLIEEPRSVEEIRRLLLVEYDVDEESCERQLQALLVDLAANGLIEVRA